MRIAVVDHIGNFGGSSRVIRALLPAMRQLRPDIRIVYFGNSVSIQREGMGKEFSAAGIKIQALKSCALVSKDIFGIAGIAAVFRLLRTRFENQLHNFPPFISGAVHREVEKHCRGFDLVYFPWPFYINCPELSCPMVGTFHDLNFRYYFSGPPMFTYDQLRILNREIPRWLERATPVVSTFFMANELAKFYPEFADKVKIVHLAPMSQLSQIETHQAQSIISEMGIKGSYILFPTNINTHKNIGPLLSAVRILCDRGHDISLIVTGPGTQIINGHASDIGLELRGDRKNVIGLGYVSNLQMDSLIQCATAVVTTSLYEAGNGPGLDAWARGVPVAMSNIPAFLEHIEVQNVRAAVFDPRIPLDIADKISDIISNPEKAKADAMHSQKALRRFTWLQTAEKYLSIFEDAVVGRLRPHSSASSPIK